MKASRSPVLDLLNLLLHFFLHALSSSTRPPVSCQEGDELNARSGSTAKSATTGTDRAETGWDAYLGEDGGRRSQSEGQEQGLVDAIGLKYEDNQASQPRTQSYRE